MKPVRQVCPGRWPITKPRAGARSRAPPTYLVPAAHRAPAPRARQSCWPGPGEPPCAPARACATAPRSARVLAEPAAPARPPPLLRARLLWPLPAPRERCPRLSSSGSSSGARPGGRGDGAGGGAGSAAEQPTGSRASRRRRPSRLRAGPGPVPPCARPRAPTCVRLRRAPGGDARGSGPAGPRRRSRGHSGPQVGVSPLEKPPSAVLAQVRRGCQF